MRPVRTAIVGQGRLRYPALVICCALGAGCRLAPPRLDGRPPTAGAAGVAWSPAEDRPALWAPAAAAADDPAPPVLGDEPLGLAELVDLALAHNPATAQAWARARAAAEAYGVARAPYWPTLQAELPLQAAYRSAATQGLPAGDSLGFSPLATLSWLVLDLGGRAAGAEAARQALLAANYQHAAALQDTVLRATLAYLRHATALAARDAAQASVAEANTDYEAALGRRAAGAGDVADELHARTALARAELAAQAAAGAVRASAATLAAAVGLPAQVALRVRPLPVDLAVRPTSATVDELVADALARRPELRAARAAAEASAARAEQLRSAGWPSLVAGGAAGLTLSAGVADPVEQLVGTLALRVPLFTGLAQTYASQQAAAEHEAAQAAAAGLAQQVALQVVSASVGLETARQAVATSEQLLDNARRFFDVAHERYEQGAGTMLALLAAQSTLADARSQQVAARLDWLANLALLAHAAGRLDGIVGDTDLGSQPAGRSPAALGDAPDDGAARGIGGR